MKMVSYSVSHGNHYFTSSQKRDSNLRLQRAVSTRTYHNDLLPLPRSAPTDDWPRTFPSHLRFRINRDPHQPMSFVFQHPLKMERIKSSETSDLNIYTPEKYPEELSTFIQHGECLKT